MTCTCPFPDVIDPGCPEHTSPAKTHSFTVTVTGCSREQAEQVIAERLGYDEDYGFGYLLHHSPIDKP